MSDLLRELEHLWQQRHDVAGELGAAMSCPPSSEGAGRRRAAVMP